MSTHVCRLPGSISGSCSASLEPNPDSKIYRTLSSARLRWDRRGNLATTSASLRYWNSARQRYCRQLVRYRKTLASLPTRSPSQQPRPARKAGFSTFENDCGRETDCLLEGDGFELPVPRTTPGFWPISTRTTRRDRCRKKGVRIRQLLVFAALGREWWARRRSVLYVSDPRERPARGPAGADRPPSSARCASNRMLPAPGCVSRRS